MVQRSLLSGGGLVVKSYLTLCYPMKYSLPGSSIHGVPQQEYWSGLPLPAPGDVSNPRIKSRSPTLQVVSCNAGGFLTNWATRKPCSVNIVKYFSPTKGRHARQEWSEDWVLLLAYVCVCVCVCVYSVTQLCLNLCDPMDCSPPGSSVCGILQARILEWVAISSSRGSSWPKDRTQVSFVSCTAGGFFTTESLDKPLLASTLGQKDTHCYILSCRCENSLTLPSSLFSTRCPHTREDLRLACSRMQGSRW